MPVQDLTPQLRTRLNRLEKWVGIFVTLAALLLLAGLSYYVYHTAQRKGWFLTKAPYFVYLRSGAGLKLGDSVKLMGFDAGEITQITAAEPYTYDDDGNMVDVYVQFEVRSPFYGYVWSDSSVKVKSAGLLGDRFLEVTKGGTSDTWTFLLGDIMDLPAFAAKLKQPSPSDRVSQYLASQLSAATRNLLSNYTGGAELRLQQALVQDLNRVIRGKLIYDTQRFAGVTLSAEITNLLEEDLEGFDDIHLNRLLLEAAYPAEISKNKPYPTYQEGKAHKLHEMLVRPSKQKPVPRGTYKPYHHGDVYWLSVEEPPELSSQMDAMLRTAKESLPGFLDLTNQLGRILNNANTAVVHLDGILLGAQPMVTNMNAAITNLTALTAFLRETEGGLGEMLLPTNLQQQLLLLLPNVNSAVTNLNTNLVSVVENLNSGLENLANITSNLHAQVQANTNILTHISTTIVDTDDFIQGLKRHWLLRSAFKKKPSAAKTNEPPLRPALSPKGESQRQGP